MAMRDYRREQERLFQLMADREESARMAACERHVRERQKRSDARPFADGTAGLADRHAFTALLGRLRAVHWIVYANGPSPVPTKSSAISGATRTVSPCRMIGSSSTVTAASGFVGKTTLTTTA